jgi:hypothetical protein
MIKFDTLSGEQLTMNMSTGRTQRVRSGRNKTKPTQREQELFSVRHIRHRRETNQYAKRCASGGVNLYHLIKTRKAH